MTKKSPKVSPYKKYVVALSTAFFLINTGLLLQNNTDWFSIYFVKLFFFTTLCVLKGMSDQIYPNARINSEMSGFAVATYVINFFIFPFVFYKFTSNLIFNIISGFIAHFLITIAIIAFFTNLGRHVAKITSPQTSP